MRIRVNPETLKLILMILTIFVLSGAALEFYDIAWGTGSAWGEFSILWGLAFLGFVAIGLSSLLVLFFVLWRATSTIPFFDRLVQFRSRMAFSRWLAVGIVMALPIWILQYSPWGVVFSKPYFRLFIWVFEILFLAFFLINNRSQAWNWPGLLAATLLSGAGFALAASLLNVTDYPFSLGWSEGNRMWDYSLLFGKHLYDYSTEIQPVAYLDIGRQLSGGLPFILPHVTIFQERLWLGLMTIIPYVVLGWITFRLPGSRSRVLPFFAGLWAWMFLSQGPIHHPLLWCAVLVALAWGRPLWLALPLVATAAYFAQLSRSTWLFAPAMWAGMLELASVPLEQFRFQNRSWSRAVIVAIVGVISGVFRIYFVPIYSAITKNDFQAAESRELFTLSAITSGQTDQPLLWYRLLPNSTYGNGILLGLLIAVLPVLIVLIYLSVSRQWVSNIWQKLAIFLPLSAFLLVGLIVSTKIGGGGDLHNMDMFLIGVMFVTAVAWRRGGVEWVESLERSPAWLRVVFLFMIAMLGYQPLMNLHPISLAVDAEWIAKLADVNTATVTRSNQSEELLRQMGSLPSNEMIDSTLEMIREYVEQARTSGDVLFMDQRQLLTFGYIQNTMLVPEYEKKMMMDKALSSDADYFEPFYRDLAAHRFSLIISDPLRAPIKDSDYQFGEENNAWVKWIALPILCYYEPVETIKYVRVQLLVPSDTIADCSGVLP